MPKRCWRSALKVAGSPRGSGRLHLFVNDVPGFYGNNQGTAKVFITPLPPTDPNDEG